MEANKGVGEKDRRFDDMREVGAGRGEHGARGRLALLEVSAAAGERCAFGVEVDAGAGYVPASPARGSESLASLLATSRV